MHYKNLIEFKIIKLYFLAPYITGKICMWFCVCAARCCGIMNENQYKPEFLL